MFITVHSSLLFPTFTSHFSCQNVIVSIVTYIFYTRNPPREIPVTDNDTGNALSFPTSPRNGNVTLSSVSIVKHTTPTSARNQTSSLANFTTPNFSFSTTTTIPTTPSRTPQETLLPHPLQHGQHQGGALPRDLPAQLQPGPQLTQGTLL